MNGLSAFAPLSPLKDVWQLLVRRLKRRLSDYKVAREKLVGGRLGAIVVAHATEIRCLNFYDEHAGLPEERVTVPNDLMHMRSTSGF